MCAQEKPRFVVVALVFVRQGDAILLVRQSYGRQYWSLPGGMMEYGESIDQAAVREVKEETGLDIHLTRVVGIYSKPAENAIAVTFEGETVGGVLECAAEDVVEAGFFPLDQLPEPIREHLVERVADYREGRAEAVIRTQ
jgi:8-oxo-dGTP diphosphatase